MTDRFQEPDGTLIIALLDESGSMAPQRRDIISGFNTFLAEQRDGPDPARLALIQFNTASRTVLEATILEDVPPLTDQVYKPSGGTALFDAVLDAIRLGDKGRWATDRLLVLIMTDGEENSSITATKESVRAAIAAKQAAGDWTFVYVGPNPEKWSTDSGTIQANAAVFNADNVQAAYLGLSGSTMSYRQSAARASANMDTQQWINRAEQASGSSPTSGSAGA